MTDLERAYAALSGKSTLYNLLFQYAEGDQPLKYSTERLRQAFDNITARFVQNWLGVVLDAELDRITLSGLDTKNNAQNTAIDAVWNEQKIGNDAYEAHRAALITGESFFIVWPDDTGAVEVYYNDPRMVHMFYRADRPKVKEFACKWWMGEDGYYLTLYYPDRLEYYQAKTKEYPTSAAAFRPMDVPKAENEYGVIPVFHLRTSSREPRSTIAGVVTLQDAVNKLLADMMVTAEYGAFPQRFIVSDSDTKTLKNAPNEIWSIPAGDGSTEGTQVGSLPTANLDTYLGSIDKIASSIAIITRTPKHYFYNAGASLSGEALLAMEAPLTKKAEQHMSIFGETWKEIGAFISRLAGAGELSPVDIIPLWQPAVSIQPYTVAQTRQLSTAAGIPLVTELKREGWTEAEIEAMEKDREEEQKRNAAIAPILLDEARARQDNANDGEDEPPANEEAQGA